MLSGLAPFSFVNSSHRTLFDSSVVFDIRPPTHLLSSIARSIDLYYLSLIHRSCHNVQERLAPVVPDGGSNLCKIRREYPNRLDHRPRSSRETFRRALTASGSSIELIPSTTAMRVDGWASSTQLQQLRFMFFGLRLTDVFSQGRQAAAPAAFHAAKRFYAADAKASPTEVSSILEQRIRGVQEEASLAETGRVLSVGYVASTPSTIHRKRIR